VEKISVRLVFSVVTISVTIQLRVTLDLVVAALLVQGDGDVVIQLTEINVMIPLFISVYQNTEPR